MEFGKPFKQEQTVIDEMKTAGMIHPEAPLPWRDEELKYLEQALGLERKILAFQIAQAMPQPGDGQKGDG
jgi:hypothetical protein